jgi:hypothetical protein
MKDTKTNYYYKPIVKVLKKSFGWLVYATISFRELFSKLSINFVFVVNYCKLFHVKQFVVFVCLFLL